MKIQHDFETNSKKNRKTQDLEIDYLDDRCFVCFIGTGAENAKKILFAKSGALLGYGDKEMKGMDYTELIPKEFRNFHESNDLFTQVLKQTKENPALIGLSPLFLVNKIGELVPVDFKVRI